jgi:outer membrane lipoprotein-sorting protein
LGTIVAVVLTLLQAAPPDLFEQVLARSRARQQSLQTLSARFTETTVSSLLKAPIVAKGTVIAERSGRMTMTYTSPEPKKVVVDAERLVVTWPGRAQREELNIADTQKRVQKYFADASAKELRGFFDVKAFEDPQVPHSYQFDMKARRKQIQQGLERLQIWVDQDTTLMIRMRMQFPGGDSKTIDLEDVKVNVPY